jgi:hypothetical protein
MGIIESFRKLPLPLLSLHITAKFLAGIGVGVLLADYLNGLGWWLILLAVLISVPSAYRILKAG